MNPVTALLMAGGQGERMAASQGGPIKPLVHVRGVPMVERNLLMLLRFGFSSLAIAVSDSQPALRRYVATRGRDVVTALGGTLEEIVETQPLGTIGAAATLAARSEDLLVVNADNLTSLNLADMLSWHRQRGAAMTVATHWQPWRSPLGEVEVHDEHLIAYHEKPEHRSCISSGIYVLGRDALDQLDGRALGAPDLVHRLQAKELPVHAFEHEAPWIDVNDRSSAARAESLIASHSDAFECWPDPARIEVAGVILAGEQGILLERRPQDAILYPGVWDTPGGKLEPGEAPEIAARREIREELGIDLAELHHITTFDDVDIASKERLRHHVFAASLNTDTPGAQATIACEWHPLQQIAALDSMSPVALRSIAAWTHRVQAANAAGHPDL